MLTKKIIIDKKTFQTCNFLVLTVSKRVQKKKLLANKDHITLINLICRQPLITETTYDWLTRIYSTGEVNLMYFFGKIVSIPKNTSLNPWVLTDEK